MPKNRRLNFLSVFYSKNAVVRLQNAIITNLAARLGIEGRCIKHHNALLTFI